MNNFATEKKGYRIEDVDKYVKKTDDALKERADRIESLKKELADKEREIAALKSKQGLIAKAVMSAVAKAEQVESLTRKKYARDVAQLKAFHDKWTAYYEKLVKKYPLDEEILSLKKFNDGMLRALGGNGGTARKMDDAEEQFRAESLRLSKQDDGFHPEERIREMLRRQEQVAPEPKKNSGRGTAAAVNPALLGESESGFNFEEALNPTEDLAAILRELGLDGEEKDE